MVVFNHLRSLGLYYCKNVTDRAMYSLGNNRTKRKLERPCQDNSREQDGIVNLNVNQCTTLTATAIQAVCDSFPRIHTCLGRNSVIISGCLSLISVQCHCAIKLIRPDQLKEKKDKEKETKDNRSVFCTLKILLLPLDLDCLHTKIPTLKIKSRR
ncbi:hypothetical protein ZIOFF_045885 [Zingiber officinale]|uniref:Uncharacterized protein n=1 Tax=Zingiber officinale TaxID=94328 RepID=A0A8J5KVP2_ZINOF|nr:hypothetical protein ZIOFF_045885 [Zingiber officinale]